MLEISQRQANKPELGWTKRHRTLNWGQSREDKKRFLVVLNPGFELKLSEDPTKIFEPKIT